MEIEKAGRIFTVLGGILQMIALVAIMIAYHMFWFVWVVGIGGIILKIFLLAYISDSYDTDATKCGLLALFFVSVLGGILLLIGASSKPYGSYYTPSAYVQKMNSTYEQSNKTADAKTKGDLAFQLKFGLITRDEYDAKMKDIETKKQIPGNANSSPKKLDSSQIASLKANLDVQLEAGLISQEEYDNRVRWLDSM